MQGKMISSLLLFVFLLVVNNCFASEKSLKRVTFAKEESQLLINLQFDDDIKYHGLLLNEPDRLVIDLDKTSLKTVLEVSNNEFIKGLRASDHEGQYLRLVFDLKKKIKHKIAYSDTNHELIITLSSNLNQAKEAITDPKEILASLPQKDLSDSVDAMLEKTTKKEEPTKLSLTHRENRKNIVVVIDPGHGGKDPGAAGPHGTREKDVVLKISKSLQTMLNDEPGLHAVLTRATDCYIPLRKRLSIARKNRADIFIAIHADAYNHSHAAGASVYALSQRGATSEAARWLAEKENESELGGLSAELADKDAILRSVLIDLSQTHTIESSLHIGKNVLGHLGRFSKLHHPRVEQAAFVVLKSPDIPSVLVETGFLSNPEEEEKLSDPHYQHETALAIKEGIKQYFLANSTN